MDARSPYYFRGNLHRSVSCSLLPQGLLILPNLEGQALTE